MLVEALVLDRDHRVLDVRRDLCVGVDDPVLGTAEDRDLRSVGRVERRVDRRAELRLGLELGELVGDRHDHPEDGRHEGERRQAQHRYRNRHPRDARDPRAQAHGSRSA